MTSTADLAANLEATRVLVAKAAATGAELIALPENFAFLRLEGAAIPCAQGLDGEIVSVLRGLAKTHRVWIAGGSFPESCPGETRVSNTSVLLSPEGDVIAVYRKIHLFDVDLRARGGAIYSESETIAPGDEIVCADTPFGRVGLSVCYDLRFPELYRELSARGARFLMIPSAFTPQTGRDHWEVLLRARAIENQCFVIAAAQFGQHGPTRASHGRSLIVDPWGLVLAQAPDRPCVIVADCDFDAQDGIRATLPALRHRRL
jgi:predicted amidohydrolase